MASITGDSSNIFINNGDLRLTRNVYAGSITLTNDTFDFASNIVIGQSGNQIAIGNQAGMNQNTYAIAIGYFAGNDSQQEGTVAIGSAAGFEYQQEYSIAIGDNAGSTSQGVKSIAIGLSAGSDHQNSYAVAIGSGAGAEYQGFQSIAIGRLAGESSQHSNTIVFNATGNALNTLQENSFYVAPVRRTDTGSTFLLYDPVNNEIVQSNTVSETVYFNNATTSFTTLSNVGIVNSNPLHPFVVGNSNLVVGTNGHVGVNTSPNNAQVSIVNGNSSGTVLDISGINGQTGNLQTWSSNTGNIVAYINASGSFHVNGTVYYTTPVVYSNNTTVSISHKYIICNNNGDLVDFYIVLPNASTNIGRELVIRKHHSDQQYRVISSASNILTLEDYRVAPTNVIISSGHATDQKVSYGDPIYRCAKIVSNGTNWVVMSGA